MNRQKRQPTKSETLQHDIQFVRNEVYALNAVLHKHLVEHHGMKDEEVKEFYERTFAGKKDE